MTHKITEIKRALVAKLIAANTDAGAHVFVNRLRPLRDADLPAILVTFVRASGDRTLQEQIRRQGEFLIRVLVKDRDADEPDTQSETILEQVEAALKADLYIGGAAEEIEQGDITAEGSDDLELVARSLSLSVRITWMQDVYSAAVDAFETANVQIDLASPRNDPANLHQPDGQIDAVSVITLPQ